MRKYYNEEAGKACQKEQADKIQAVVKRAEIEKF